MGWGRYILVDGEPVEEPDLLTWARWMETDGNRTIARDYVGTVKVSTIFTGLDQSYSLDPDAEPILFETMVFGGPLDHYQRRYTSRHEAEVGHVVALALVQGE